MEPTPCVTKAAKQQFIGSRQLRSLTPLAGAGLASLARPLSVLLNRGCALSVTTVNARNRGK
jgi:hypothetical protein